MARLDRLKNPRSDDALTGRAAMLAAPPAPRLLHAATGEELSRPGKGQLEHHDPLSHSCYDRGPHVHDPCRCDPDDPANLRGHIAVVLAGHWPLDDDEDIAIDHVCKGYIRRTDAVVDGRKRALSRGMPPE